MAVELVEASGRPSLGRLHRAEQIRAELEALERSSVMLQLVEGEVPAVKDEAYAGKIEPDRPERWQPSVLTPCRLHSVTGDVKLDDRRDPDGARFEPAAISRQFALVLG
jgi:hypothetical protein